MIHLLVNLFMVNNKQKSSVVRLNQMIYNLLALNKCLKLGCSEIKQLLSNSYNMFWTCPSFMYNDRRILWRIANYWKYFKGFYVKFKEISLIFLLWKSSQSINIQWRIFKLVCFCENFSESEICFSEESLLKNPWPCCY